MKIHWGQLKIFSRTTKPISTKLGTKHPWIIWFQVCSKEGPCPFSKGDTKEIVEIHLQSFKTFFSRITGPILINLGIKHPWVKEIQSFTNKDHSIFKNEIMYVFSPNQCNDIIIMCFLIWTGFSGERCGPWALFKK